MKSMTYLQGERAAVGARRVAPRRTRAGGGAYDIPLQPPARTPIRKHARSFPDFSRSS